MNAQEWCKEHHITIHCDWDNPHYAQYGRVSFDTSVSVHREDGTTIGQVDTGNWGPSPIWRDDYASHLYDSILGFMQYFAPETEKEFRNYEPDPDEEDEDMKTATHKFLALLSEETRNEFINGWIDFEE